jgi:hypothetical protein
MLVAAVAAVASAPYARRGAHRHGQAHICNSCNRAATAAICACLCNERPLFPAATELQQRQLCCSGSSVAAVAYVCNTAVAALLQLLQLYATELQLSCNSGSSVAAGTQGRSLHRKTHISSRCCSSVALCCSSVAAQSCNRALQQGCYSCNRLLQTATAATAATECYPLIIRGCNAAAAAL